MREGAGVNVRTGAFEDMELPVSYYDLVYSATAIHWIKPDVKFTKPHALLKPDGYLAIIHTEHVSDESGDEFFSASQPIYKRHHKKKPSNKQIEFILPRLKDLRPPEKIDKKLFSLEDFTVFPIISYSSQECVDMSATLGAKHRATGR